MFCIHRHVGYGVLITYQMIGQTDDLRLGNSSFTQLLVQKQLSPAKINYQGPVVQSIVSLTSSLVVKMLTVSK